MWCRCSASLSSIHRYVEAAVLHEGLVERARGPKLRHRALVLEEGDDIPAAAIIGRSRTRLASRSARSPKHTTMASSSVSLDWLNGILERQPQRASSQVRDAPQGTGRAPRPSRAMNSIDIISSTY
jgi:hypothetical protein